MVDEFKYSNVPLDARGETSIRVVELFPGSATEMLRLQLKVVPLDNPKDPPNFEALSYCWGGTKNAAFPITIRCNNQNLVIHNSLNIALCHLRYPDKPRTIWADAICINQTNDDEKAEQVPLMRKIYEKANRVVIWLGEDGPDEIGGLDSGKRAFGLVRLLVKAYDDKFRGPPKEILEISRHVPGVEKGPDGKLIKDPWDDFVKLLDRPWFGRVWIIQESSVASDAIVDCGGSSVSWIDFIKALAYITSTPTLKTIYPVGSLQFRQVTGLLLGFVAFKHREGQGILTLLQQHRPCDATLPKDKVFAIHGIANDCGPEMLDLNLDYRLETKDVYIETAIAILLRSAELNILAVPRVVSLPELSDDLKLPSWVPNWMKCDLAETFCEEVYGFDASRGTVPNVHIVKYSKLGEARVVSSQLAQTHEIVPPKILARGKSTDLAPILGASGFVLDRIVDVGALWDLDPTSNPFISVPKAQTIYNNWEAVAKARSKSRYTATNEPILDAYYKCLQAGNAAEEFESTSALRQQMDNNSRRFRFLHNMGLHNHKKTYLGASWGVMMYNVMADVYHERPSGAMAPGLRLTRVPHRRMFRTETGYIGIGPRDMKVGDSTSLFTGSKVPLVVRNREVLLELVGDCYLHGVMAGEAFDETKCEMMWFK